MIFLLIFPLVLLIIAVFARYIDPDRLLRTYDPPLRVSAIVQSGLSSQLYQADNGTCILQDWLFRVGSIKDPLLNIQTNWRSDGVLSLLDKQGREFLIDKAAITPANTLAENDVVATDPGDQAIFQVSRSIIPYYYGWRILSSAPIFRHFRYYKLSIRQASGATLKVEWKFTTYKMPNGSWVPDYLGLRGEGLIRVHIKMV